MKVHGLLLERHTGAGEERRHDGRVAVNRPDTRWCSQHRAASFEPGLADATRLRGKLARSEAAMGQGALAIWGLRALSHCVGCSNHIQSANDSNFPWLKVG